VFQRAGVEFPQRWRNDGQRRAAVHWLRQHDVNGERGYADLIAMGF
jgi:hypothetical protein